MCKTVIKGEMWKTARHISGGVFIQLSELRLLFPELENFVLFRFFFCGLRQEPLATLKEQPRRGPGGYVAWGVPGWPSAFCPLIQLNSFNSNVLKSKFFWQFNLIHLVSMGLESLSLISQPPSKLYFGVVPKS